MKSIPFSGLAQADLIVDAVYEGGKAGNASDDPISRLLPGSGNQGGFRAPGSEDNRFVVLYTSGEDKDWPDSLDSQSGQFTYYGDNKSPGRELHDLRGNRILRRVFSQLHSTPPDRSSIPPFFVFQKSPTSNSSRSVQFRGLAVPGFRAVPATSDLIAVWKTASGQRFQNYRSIFTILDAAIISRAWLDELTQAKPAHMHAPRAWGDWRKFGRYEPLVAEPTTIVRNASQQLPDTELKRQLLNGVWLHFRDRPHAFEPFAARMYQMHDPRVIVDQITRSTVDGGRDATGRYRLGLEDDPVYAEFALEAKCYRPPSPSDPGSTLGVPEVARLISRIRHREFGVIVTTSIVSRQAYQEVRTDRHPVIILAGGDLTNILVKNGINTLELLAEFLQSEFPKSMSTPPAPSA